MSANRILLAPLIFIDTGTYLLESWIEHTNEYTMTAATDGKDTEIFPLAQLHYNDKRQLISVATPANIHDDMLKEMQRIVKVLRHLLNIGVYFRLTFCYFYWYPLCKEY